MVTKILLPHDGTEMSNKSPTCEIQDKKTCNDVLCFLNIHFEYKGVTCNGTLPLCIYD